MWEFILSSLFLLNGVDAVIYRLNESQYNLMPDVYKFDDYEACMKDEDALFCTLTMELVSDTPSLLLDLIREYSKDTVKHFNHSILYRGVCMTRSCESYNSKNIQDTAEACLNNSLWKDYGLKSKVKRIQCLPNNEDDVDFGDYVYAFVVVVILLLNFVGSLYDRFGQSDKITVGQKVLLCFSIIRNWTSLVAPPSPETDTRLKRLKVLHIFRAVTVMLVVTTHGLVSFFMFIDNTYFVENMYYDPISHIFLNGTIVIQAFFIISGFLVTYNLEIYAEKHAMRLNLFFKCFIMRWLRITPAYLIVLGFTSTWARLLGTGPAWHIVVRDESSDCRKYWWQHILYINNYFDGSQCSQHSWYLAGEMQLHILGVCIALVCGTRRSRVTILSSLALVGFVLPAIQIYMQDLDALILASPSAANTFFVNEKTFNHLYKPMHNNLFAYVTGLSLGYLVYYLQKINFNMQKYRKYNFWYWLLVPIAMLIMLVGNIFYKDGPRESILVRILYGTLSKPIYCVVVALFIAGAIFKVENFIRAVCEWRGWVVPGRLSYSAFLLHFTLIKLLLGANISLQHVSLKNQILQSLQFSLLSMCAAVPLHILVEMPFWKLSKILFSSRSLSKNN